MNLSLKLFLEIAGSNYVFFVSEIDQHNNCKIVYNIKCRVTITHNDVVLLMVIILS